MGQAFMHFGHGLDCNTAIDSALAKVCAGGGTITQEAVLRTDRATLRKFYLINGLWYECWVEVKKADSATTHQIFIASLTAFAKSVTELRQRLNDAEIAVSKWPPTKTD
jgi:hypothetical protein